MHKFKHILYYDLKNTLRNCVLSERLSLYCDKLSILLVDDDHPSNIENSEFVNCDALVTGVFDNYPSRLANNLKLKYIFMLATDTSDFDHDFLRERNIYLSNAEGYSSEAVAELSIAMMILLVRKLHISGSHISIDTIPGHEIAGQTIAIIGAGRIGTKIGSKAAKLGMNVYYSGKINAELESLGAKSFTPGKSASNVDVYSINLPLTPETTGLLDHDYLSGIKDNAVILCPSRLELFNLQFLTALLNARNCRLWFDHGENPKLQDIVCEHSDRVIVTNSLGAKTLNSQERMISIALRNIESYVAKVTNYSN